ncbi:hypothetical protein ACYR1G_005288, partial [Escherichia coli]
LDHHNDDPDVHLFPNGVKAPTVTMFVMVALIVCVVIITIQDPTHFGLTYCNANGSCLSTSTVFPCFVA